MLTPLTGAATLNTEIAAEGADVPLAVTVAERVFSPSWSGVPGAKSYHIECALDPGDAGVWTACGRPTRRSCTVTGLVSGKRMWFRVVAIGATGQGPCSDPATCYVG